jgi:hypothetical protein
MIRLRRVPARSVKIPFTFAAVAAIVVLSLAGCSAASGPSPKASPGSTPSGTSGASAGALKDESASVLAWVPPAPVAKTEGKLSNRFVPGPGTIPSTAEIISVKASADSTILTWQMSSPTDMTMAGYTLTVVGLAGSWPDTVRLVDPVGEKSYGVNTLINYGKVTVLDKTYCVCARFPAHVGPDPVRMTAAYPPLPAGATSISVQIPYFAPVTVPVTR